MHYLFMYVVYMLIMKYMITLLFKFNDPDYTFNMSKWGKKFYPLGEKQDLPIFSHSLS